MSSDGQGSRIRGSRGPASGAKARGVEYIVVDIDETVADTILDRG